MIITKDNKTTHKVYNENFFEVCLPTVDFVLTDLPYGTTKAKWDTCVNLQEMWKWLEHCTKDDTAVCLFSQTPFDKILGVSNIEQLRYEWIWEKTHPNGHFNAKKMPMKAHENVLTFYKKLPLYNPQKTSGHVLKSAVKKKEVGDRCELYGKDTKTVEYNSTERYPRDVLKFSSDKQKLSLNSTQKPLSLLRYLIRTYTNIGDTVLDFTAGSFSTGVAAYLEGRNSILVEKEKDQFDEALNWLKCCKIEDPYNIT